MRQTWGLLLLVLPFSVDAACTKPSNIPAYQFSTYYQGINTQSGDELKSLLHAIIANHHKYSYRCVWDILKEADEDPTQSNNIILIYTRRSHQKDDRDSGGSNLDAWNREHLWAKSHGFPSSSRHAYTDAHHLRPADKSVNSSRGNKDFDNGGSVHSECDLCKADSDSWEPPNEVKGDIARAMFYMALRYEGTDGGTPDLELVDRMTGTGEPHLGKLCTLYAWHQNDVVSAAERQRNDVIYSWQGNRNPFIDNPLWLDRIWGSECGAVVPPEDEPLNIAKVTRYQTGWDFSTNRGFMVLYFDEAAGSESFTITDIQPGDLKAIMAIFEANEHVYYDSNNNRIFSNFE